MLSTAPETKTEDPALGPVLMLIRLITLLVVLEYVVDVFFLIYSDERNYLSVRIDNLTFLVGTLLFYLSFTRVSERIDSIQFREDFQDNQN